MPTDFNIDALLNSVLARRGIGTAAQLPTDEPQLPDLTPDEQESLLSQITGGILGGVQYVGETLDKPGAALRGLLAGQPEELLNLIPFSDAMGITNPEERVSGRDLLERGGLLDANTPGLDAGDVAGFGAEVLLDPLNLVSFGGKGAITAAGKALMAADKAAGVVPRMLEHAVSPAQHIAELAGDAGKLGAAASLGEHSGAALRTAQEAAGGANTPLRGFMGFGLEGSPLGWIGKKAGLWNETTPFLGSNIVPAWATGGLPAKALEKVYYGKYSPVRRVRNLLDNRTGEQIHGAAQMLFDIGKAEEVYLKAKVIDEGANVSKHVLDSAPLYQELASITDPEDMGQFENFMRTITEMKDGTTREQVAEALNFATGNNRFDEAVTHFHNLATDLQTKDKTIGTLLKQLGMPLSFMDDAYIGHMPRRFDQSLIQGTEEQFKAAKQLYGEQLDTLKESGIGADTIAKTHKLGKKWTDVEGFGKVADDLGIDPEQLWEQLVAGPPKMKDFSGKRFLSANPWFAEARDDIWKDIPGGTAMVNRITAIPWIVGRNKATQRDMANAMMHALSNNIPFDTLQPVSKQAFELALDDIASKFGMTSKQVRGTADQLWESTKAKYADDLLLYQQAAEAVGLPERELQRLFSTGADPDAVARLDDIAKELSARSEFMGHIRPDTAVDDLWSLLERGKPRRPRRAHAETLAEVRSVMEGGNYTRSLYGDDLIPWSGYQFTREGVEQIAESMVGSKDYKHIFLGQMPDQTAGDMLVDYLQSGGKVNIPKGAEELSITAPQGLEYSTDMAARYISNLAGIHIDKARQIARRMENMDPALLGKGFEAGSFDNLDEATSFAKSQYDLHNGAREYAVVKKKGKFVVTAPDGMFNQGIVKDFLDYQQSAARVQWSLQAVHRMLSNPEIAVDMGKGLRAPHSLADAWKAMGLTDEGLMTLMQKRGAQDIPNTEEAWKAAESISVPPEVTTGATRFLKAHTQPESISGVLGAVDRMLSMFKGGVTLPWIAHHVRNRASGIYANWQAGQWTASSMVKSQRLASGKAIEVAGMDGDALLREAMDHGVLEHDTLYDIAESGAQATGRPPSLLDALKQSVADESGDVSAKSIVKSLNPLSTRGGPTFSELLGKGKTIDERITGFVKPKETSGFAPMKAGEAVRKNVEFHNRMEPYIALRDAGYSAAETAQKVKAAQFDYSNLTHFERTVMKRIIPFYTYSRMNLPFQLRMLLEHPGGRTAQTIRAYQNVREEGNDSGYVPKYLAESLALPVGGDGDTKKYLAISGLLPFEEAFNRFAFTGGIPDVKRTLQKHAGQLNFMIQQPIESMTDTQLWSGRRKSSLYQEPTFSPAVNAMLYSGAIPYAPRAISTGRPFFDSRKSLAQAVGNALVGGVKVTDVSPEARLLEARDVLQRDLPGQRGVGEFTRVYARDIDRMPVDAQRKLSLYNALATELTTRRKAKEKKKAGR